MTEGLRRGYAPPAIPVLETERLILRGFRLGDEIGVAAIHGDEETMRFLGGHADPSPAEAFRAMLVYTGHWTLYGCGKWAVEEKASGRLIGRAGYADSPYDWPGLELGWTFVRDSWGRGFAQEAAIAARDWGFRNLALDRVTSMIHPDNHASQAVARRVGERPWRPFVFRGLDQMLWSITRAEWEAVSRAGAA